MRSNEILRDGLTQPQLYELNSSSNYQSFFHITEAIIYFLSTPLEMAAVNPSQPSPPSPASEIVTCPLLRLLFLSLLCQPSGPRPTHPSEVPNLDAWTPSLVNKRETLSVKSSLGTNECALFFLLSMISRVTTQSTPAGVIVWRCVGQSSGTVLHLVNAHLFIRHFLWLYHRHTCIKKTVA